MADPKELFLKVGMTSSYTEKNKFSNKASANLALHALKHRLNPNYSFTFKPQDKRSFSIGKEKQQLEKLRENNYRAIGKAKETKYSKDITALLRKESDTTPKIASTVSSQLSANSILQITPDFTNSLDKKSIKDLTGGVISYGNEKIPRKFLRIDKSSIPGFRYRANGERRPPSTTNTSREQMVTMGGGASGGGGVSGSVAVGSGGPPPMSPATSATEPTNNNDSSNVQRMSFACFDEEMSQKYEQLQKEMERINQWKRSDGTRTLRRYLKKSSSSLHPDASHRSSVSSEASASRRSSASHRSSSSYSTSLSERSSGSRVSSLDAKGKPGSFMRDVNHQIDKMRSMEPRLSRLRVALDDYYRHTVAEVNAASGQGKEAKYRRHLVAQELSI